MEKPFTVSALHSNSTVFSSSSITGVNDHWSIFLLLLSWVVVVEAAGGVGGCGGGLWKREDLGWGEGMGGGGGGLFPMGAITPSR